MSSLCRASQEKSPTSKRGSQERELNLHFPRVSEKAVSCASLNPFRLSTHNCAGDVTDGSRGEEEKMEEDMVEKRKMKGQEEKS
jgi:hypothetical protein